MENDQNKQDPQPKTIELEVIRHRQLFNMLRDPRMMWRMVMFLFVLLAVFIVGLTIMLMILKKYYPYNTITTNNYGATIMSTEDREVTYWLFNTADLWANSGIRVEKGDILTIRASGAAHTAVHHLVEECKINTIGVDKWVSTDGQPKTSYRDQLRAKYRISPTNNEGTLLMRIVPDGEENKTADGITFTGNIYVIGRERQNLVVTDPGTLCFTINDIVLSDTIINKMYLDAVTQINLWNCNNGNGKTIDTKKAFQILNAFQKDTDTPIQKITDDLTDYISDCKNDTNFCNAMRNTYSLGKYRNTSGLPPSDGLLLNELLYYKYIEFENAWYVDNIGSFLIVIEKQHN